MKTFMGKGNSVRLKTVMPDNTTPHKPNNSTLALPTHNLSPAWYFTTSPNLLDYHTHYQHISPYSAALLRSQPLLSLTLAQAADQADYDHDVTIPPVKNAVGQYKGYEHL